MIRRILLLLSLAFGMLHAMAFSIKGKVLDENSEPMMQASVRVLKPDSTLLKGVLTNEDGAFTISGINAGNYIVETSFVGYDSQSRNIKISNADITLKPIEMQAGALMLREAEVVGVRTPVKVMQDTVEYNADAYRTQPNAVVEDLLKRLPGVEVDSEGKITANGKSVTKILIDGKEFFCRRPQGGFAKPAGRHGRQTAGSRPQKRPGPYNRCRRRRRRNRNKPYRKKRYEQRLVRQCRGRIRHRRQV